MAKLVPYSSGSDSDNDSDGGSSGGSSMSNTADGDRGRGPARNTQQDPDAIHTVGEMGVTASVGVGVVQGQDDHVSSSSVAASELEGEEMERARVAQTAVAILGDVHSTPFAPDITLPRGRMTRSRFKGIIDALSAQRRQVEEDAQLATKLEQEEGDDLGGPRVVGSNEEIKEDIGEGGASVGSDDGDPSSESEHEPSESSEGASTDDDQDFVTVPKKKRRTSISSAGSVSATKPSRKKAKKAKIARTDRTPKKANCTERSPRKKKRSRQDRPKLDRSVPAEQPDTRMARLYEQLLG